jgi:hypothetical protein
VYPIPTEPTPAANSNDRGVGNKGKGLARLKHRRVREGEEKTGLALNSMRMSAARHISHPASKAAQIETQNRNREGKKSLHTTMQNFILPPSAPPLGISSPHCSLCRIKMPAVQGKSLHEMQYAAPLRYVPAPAASLLRCQTIPSNINTKIIDDNKGVSHSKNQTALKKTTSCNDTQHCGKCLLSILDLMCLDLKCFSFSLLKSCLFWCLAAGLPPEAEGTSVR